MLYCRRGESAWRPRAQNRPIEILSQKIHAQKAYTRLLDFEYTSCHENLGLYALLFNGGNWIDILLSILLLITAGNLQLYSLELIVLIVSSNPFQNHVFLYEQLN